MKEICRRIEQFALSDLYAPLLFLLVYGLVVLDAPVVALCVLLFIGCTVCFACEDLVPLLLPLFLIFCLAIVCLPTLFANSMAGQFIWVIGLSIPCAFVLLRRFILMLKGVRPGAGFPGIIAVSLALMLGGLGVIPASEYFSVGAVYHILFIGPMMIFFYLFFRGNARVTSS